MSITSGEECGTAVVWYLLANAAAVTAVVPSTQIMEGDVPVNTPMPAIGVKQISSVPYNLIKTNTTPKVHTDRVQVTAFRGASPGDSGYPGLKSLLTLILAALSSRYGSVNGINVQSITPDVEGPDLSIEPEGIVSRSRDFLVRWSI